MEANDYVQGTLVPKTLLEPLGLLLVHFSLLEECLDDNFALFLDLDKARGEFIAAQFNSFRVKLDILDYLAEKSLPQEYDRTKFSDAIKLSREANSARNDIIHGDWHYGGMLYPRLSKRNITRGGNPKVIEITVQTVLDAAHKAYIAYVAMDLAPKMVTRVPPKDLPFPWPGAFP